MAAPAWSGAVEFNGFPIHVRLYNRVKSRSGESFRTLAPNGEPVRSAYMDTEGNEVERSECGKGIEVSKGSFVALSADAIESIGDAEKTTMMMPRAFCPLATIPLELAEKSYAVVPDSKVPGSEGPVSILWNGLLERELAYVTQVTVRSGSRDAIICLYAKEDGLYAVALPFEAELNDTPSHEFEVDEKARTVFSKFVSARYADELGDFDHSAFQSEWRERRREAIEAAVDDRPVQVAEKPKAAETPDLMAALEAAVEDAGAKAAKPKAKKASAKGRKKVSA